MVVLTAVNDPDKVPAPPRADEAPEPERTEEEVPQDTGASDEEAEDIDTPEAIYIRDIRDARARLREAEAEWTEAKEAAKEAKKIWEACVTELSRVIDAGPQRLPLFDGKGADKADDDDEGEDTWQKVPVTELDLPVGIARILIEEGYETIGKIAEFSADDHELTEIPRIGKAKAEAIENALEEYWESHSI